MQQAIAERRESLMMTMREAFEIWVRQSTSFTDWTRGPDGTYHRPLVEQSWQAWCAAVEWSRADGENAPQSFIEAKKERDDGWPDLSTDT
jgi:hypothetical protein